MDRLFVLGRDQVPSHVVLSAGEAIRWTIVALPGHSGEMNLDVELDGPGADVDIAGLYICPSGEQLTLNVNMKHISGGCTSRQLFKGLVGGQSVASFEGLVYVRKDAQKTRAYQENHTILLDRGAQVRTQPQLEIYADDVECSHGATTGFLNEDELFYMRSRGINETDARRLQMISFLAPVLERLPEELKQEVLSTL